MQGIATRLGAEGFGQRPLPEISTALLRADAEALAQRERQSLAVPLEEQVRWRGLYKAFNAWRSAVSPAVCVSLTMR